ncbi:hypothetical protein [Microbacterium paraoxydans]|uniref:hypothetical protein n=1 Tax=Microbacterium paraoxydans TaxID=199592 RepID=UPI0030139E95
MSEPADESDPSLIPQRLALQRRRTWAIVLAVFWLRRALRDIRDFEARHGADAGRR